MSDRGPFHPKNAPGPLYVLDGCCTACGVPTSIAPELFEFDSNDHCYVTRQPDSDSEMEKALRVIRAQELECVRYQGTDAEILRRLAEAGEAEHCDHPLLGVGVVLRNVVSFVIADADARRTDPVTFLERFSDYVREQFAHLRVRTKRIEYKNNEASFALAWFEDHFHPITIRAVDSSRQMVIVHRGNLGLSELLDDWLRSIEHVEGIRWYAEEAWNSSGEWQSRPW